ncbi:DUF3817 domain-containing protein [Micrococcales bacterium 31B]|nr:DUF3817 domain-containing protein [Micrococcales bacterium 31B]
MTGIIQHPRACAHWPALRGLAALAENVEAAAWVQAFKVVAVLEAISWAGLITGMIFKYGPADNELGVTVFGPIHGGIFVIYLVITGFTALVQHWNFKESLLGMLSSVPPFFTVVFEIFAARRGLLDPQRVTRPTR